MPRARLAWAAVGVLVVLGSLALRSVGVARRSAGEPPPPSRPAPVMARAQTLTTVWVSPSPSPIPSPPPPPPPPPPSPPRPRAAPHVHRAPRPAPRPGVEQWRALVTANGRTAWDPNEVLRVMSCESSGNPNAISPGGHRGLMQIDGGPLDPEHNLAWAYGMWQRWGWSRWSCKP